MTFSTPAVQREPAFEHYSLKHRLIAWVSAHLFDRITYTSRHGLTRGMKRRGGLGWWPFAPAKTPEEHFWEMLDLRDAVVYDVGAFHGLLTIYFAKTAGRVIAFEPTTQNRGRLEQNIALNRLSNVTVRPVGLGSVRETLAISVDEGRSGIGGSGPKTQPVTITTLDQDIADNALPAPTFVKIDVEGFELEVLKGARKLLATARPELFLEMHGATLADKRRKVAEIVAFLAELGYSIDHVETGTRITMENSAVACQGHLHCRA